MSHTTVRRWFSRLLPAALVVALALPVAAIAQAAPPSPDSATVSTLPNSAVFDGVISPESVRAAKEAAGKLDSTLAQLAAASEAEDTQALAAFAGMQHVDVAAGGARVILEMDADPEAHPGGTPSYETVTLANGQTATIEHAPRVSIRLDLAHAIAATGARYESAYASWVQVWAPFSSLRSLGKIEGVRTVRLPFPSQPDALPGGPAAPAGAGPQVGSSTSQGVTLTNISTWHSNGYNGTGIKLAVFDWGFTNWTARKTSGDLPAGLIAKDFSATFDFAANANQGTTGYNHGTGCAEIAYDMAPDATVYLYAAYTEVEVGNAINDYRTTVTGNRVASMSIGWVNAGPYDGTGSINTLIDNAQASGIFWAHSAGNQQRSHHSWTSAQYSTGNSVAFGAGNVNAFGPDSTTSTVWNIGSGNTITAFLEWNDWNAARTGNQAHVDYDLYLLKWNGSAWAAVASSVGDQCTGTAAPTESIGFTTTSNTNPYYSLLIQRDVTGCTNNFGHWMQLHTFTSFYTSGVGTNYAFWYRNVCNSVTIPADSASAVAAGATFWGEDGLSPLYGLETFSSLGPTNASGGADPGAAVNKPDVTAPDGVDNATYGANGNLSFANGGGGFWGTSAAAPHVAGLAAALWEQAPGASLSTLRSAIQGQAQYRASGDVCGGARSAVQNNRYGWGRIYVNAPLAVTLADFAAQQQGAAFEVTWETVSELDNASFNVYRADSADGAKTLVAAVPSQAPGSAQGASYRIVDAGVQAGRTYWYSLEDVDLSGAATLHGPVSVALQAPAAVTLESVRADAGASPAGAWAVLAAVVALVAARWLRRRSTRPITR